MSLSPDVTQTVGKFGSAALFQGLGFNPDSTLASIAGNLVAWWKLNAVDPKIPSGTQFTDVINGNNISISSGLYGPLITTGKFVNGLGAVATTIVGNEPRINTGVGPLLVGIPTGNNPISFALWFKLSTLSPTNAKEYLVSIGQGGYGLFGLYVHPAANTVGIGAISTHYAEYASVADTSWHHFAASWDGSSALSGIQVYVDGNLLISPSAISDTSMSLPANGVTNLDLCHRADTPLGGGTAPDAVLDDVRIYNISLTPTQALAIYEASSDTQ